MGERGSAAGRLERILYLLPAASRPGGAEIPELAGRLDVDPDVVLADLREVADRTFYHPAGEGDEFQISLEGNQVNIWSGRKFERPSRLSTREALALALGLRALAAESTAPRRERLLELARRLDGDLAAAPSEDLWASFAIDESDRDGSGLRSVLLSAVQARRRCRMRYLTPGRDELSERVIAPYVVASAGGRSYVIGHCGLREEVRVFRLDRIVDVEPVDASFEVPEGFDPARYLAEGRVYRAEEEMTARVRYAKRIAPWVRERGPVEVLASGDVVVTFRVSDPGWLVRHVLSHGPDAEVLEPPGLRSLVAETLRAAIRDEG
ncbi:MAG: helix-turn-helix transcriptional regulator [Gemmatimonadota bacterium]